MSLPISYTPAFEEYFRVLFSLKWRVDSSTYGLSDKLVYESSEYRDAVANSYVRRGDFSILEFVIFVECCRCYNLLPAHIKIRALFEDGLTLGTLYESRDVIEDALLVACHVQSAREEMSPSPDVQASRMMDTTVLIELYQLALELARSVDLSSSHFNLAQDHHAHATDAKREELMETVLSLGSEDSRIDQLEAIRREARRTRIRKHIVSLKAELQAQRDRRSRRRTRRSQGMEWS